MTLRRAPNRLGFPLALCLIALVGLFQSPLKAAEDSKGTDFWLMFNANLGAPTLTLFITGDVATTGTVSIPGLAVNLPFTVTPGTVTSVPIPTAAAVGATDGIENKGIHVTANAEVTVYGLNRIPQTTDAFLGLPTDILGTEHLVMSYNGLFGAPSEIGIVAVQNATTVTITPKVASGARAANVPFNVVLNQGQAYQLQATGTGDLTGSLITSDKPVGVFGAVQCVNVPVGFTFCDHIVEQLPPTSTWGQSFVTMPLATRLRGDTFRFLASENGTQVSVNGVLVATINRGQFHERLITGPASITSTGPLLVAQYSNGTSFDGVTSDPFMMLIPPYEQFLGNYTITTPASGFATNFVNVVAPTAAIGTITQDGVAIPAGAFTPIAGTTFSGAQRAVTLGSHRFAGLQPFGVFTYGFDSFDSYGYPGGLALAQVALVSDIDLTPKVSTNPVNSQHCVVATVSDQFGQPVTGVRVDFTVSGVHTTNGFAFTSAQGTAQFCYNGTVPGVDSIVATVGTISDSAGKTWTAVDRLVCDVDGDKDVDMVDIGLINAARNTVAAPGDPRDANNSGRIDVVDSRFCTVRRTAVN